jgi:DNA-binding response OmpR family regulator
MTGTAPDRLLLVVVGPAAEAAGLAERLPRGAADVVVCADTAEALRALRSVRPEPGDLPVRVGALRLDPATMEADLHGRRVPLPPREFRLLHLLMTNAGQVLTRDQIRAAVWGGTDGDASNTITVHIQRLRARLGDDLIQTVRRLGYRLVPPPKRTKIN